LENMSSIRSVLQHDSHGIAMTEVPSIGIMSHESLRSLNQRNDERANTRINHWLVHESVPTDSSALKYVGCIYQFTTQDNKKAVQFMNNWVTVFNALR
jgi:carbamate kinase